MIDWYLSVQRLIRSIDRKARDALPLCEQNGKEDAEAIRQYILDDYHQLQKLWNSRFPEEMRELGRHIRFGEPVDYRDILQTDLPALEQSADYHLEESQVQGEENTTIEIQQLLHPVIRDSAWQLYLDGHLRESVLTGVTAVFDLIRDKTGLRVDGDRLVGSAFSLQEPYLVLSELDTESGENDQKGFMQIYKGAYQGIRNPKAHTLNHDLDPDKAAEYLIFMSLLARRADEANLTEKCNSE